MELWDWKARALLGSSKKIGGLNVVVHRESWSLKDAQAFVVYLVDKNPNTVALFAGDNYVIFAKNKEFEGLNMKELLKEVLFAVGGGGGGSENLARGGGFRAAPEEVLERAFRALEKKVVKL